MQQQGKARIQLLTQNEIHKFVILARLESIPESESESESTPWVRVGSRSRSRPKTHRLRSPGWEPRRCRVLQGAPGPDVPVGYRPKLSLLEAPAAPSQSAGPSWVSPSGVGSCNVPRSRGACQMSLLGDADVGTPTL